MAYFNVFPLVRMNNGTLAVNITARTAFLSKYRDDPRYYYEHSIGEGETPEIIADKFYDDATLAAFILMFNGIINVYEEWPMDSYSLDLYIDDKYANPNDIHHYVAASTGNIVDADYPVYDRVPVTNAEYEIELNESRRKIKLILPELIGSVVAQHRELMTR